MKNDNTWYNLDNQAIIYPAVSDQKNTNVYRLTCTLVDMVNPSVLQQAVNETLHSFPYYQMVLRRGLFWFYLESTKQMPEVAPESERPCNQIFQPQVKELLFKTYYFNNKIHIEVFHALADGGGAMEFFKVIVYNYLVITHKTNFGDNNTPVLERKAAPASQAEDSFKKYYTKGLKDSRSGKKAFIIGGSNLPQNDIQIISAKMSTKEILKLVKSQNSTLTAYLTALIILSIYKEMLPKRYIGRDVSINVPVDLRSMFPSQSFRNFFTVVEIRYNFANFPDDFDSVLNSVTDQLKEKITKENLVKTLNYHMSAQENYFARAVPLVIKNKVLKLIYQNNESTATTTISNVGRVIMPPELVPYIEDFNCLLNPTPIHKVKLCITSFEDAMVMNFTSRIYETNIERFFVRHLTDNGVKICLTTNRGDQNEIL